MFLVSETSCLVIKGITPFKNVVKSGIYYNGAFITHLNLFGALA